MLQQDKINTLIPKAMEAIQAVQIADINGFVAKEFEGYIASFGSNINQSGLLPTLLFFKNDSGKSQKSSLWLNAIIYVLTNGEKQNGLISYVIEETKKQELQNYKLTDLDIDKVDEIESEILAIVAALKMAVRTFKLKKND